MKHSQLDAMLAESGFDPDDVEHLAAVLNPLAELSADAPAPSAELLALFGGDAHADAERTAQVVPIVRGRNRGVLAGAIVLALSGVGATGLSAAANTLPSPLQHQVSDFSHRYLPFDFPEPTVEIPHLAEVPGAQETLDPTGAIDPEVSEEQLRTAEEISRSLPGGRPDAKAAPGWAPHRRDRVVRPAHTATHTRASPSPPASSGASSAPLAASPSSTKPNAVKGDSPTYAPASPAKTASSHPNGAKPGKGGNPSKGSGNPVKGGPAVDPPPATDPGPVNGTGSPDPGDLLPGLPDIGIPIEGGPVLDRVTPGDEGDAGDS